MTIKDIDKAIRLILDKKDLQKHVDRRLIYDLRNQTEERKVSEARKLSALFQAGLLQIKDGEI